MPDPSLSAARPTPIFASANSRSRTISRPCAVVSIVQRNGRVSRHGQVRDVSVHYFRCDQEEDMNFLAYVADKASTIQDLRSRLDLVPSGFTNTNPRIGLPVKSIGMQPFRPRAAV